MLIKIMLIKKTRVYLLQYSGLKSTDFANVFQPPLRPQPSLVSSGWVAPKAVPSSSPHPQWPTKSPCCPPALPDRPSHPLLVIPSTQSFKLKCQKRSRSYCTMISRSGHKLIFFCFLILRTPWRVFWADTAPITCPRLDSSKDLGTSAKQGHCKVLYGARLCTWAE